MQGRQATEGIIEVAERFIMLGIQLEFEKCSYGNVILCIRLAKKLDNESN